MLYYGVITGVHPPADLLNYNGFQYEYSVCIETDYKCAVPLRNVLVMERFGAADDFSDHVLTIGQKVCVMTIRNDLSQAIIVGGIRNSRTKTVSERHLRERFNAVTKTIDGDGNYTIELDQGEHLKIHKDYIKIDNSSGESVVIDKRNKSITVNAGGNWNVEIGGNAKINVKGKVDLTAGRTATVEAPQIKLGKSAGEAVVRGDIFKKLFDQHQHVGNMGCPTTPPIIPLLPIALSKKVKTE